MMEEKWVKGLVVIKALRVECARVRDMAHYRLHELAKKVKNFCALEKECRMLMEKFEGMCHAEDIMRMEITMEETVVEKRF